MDNQFVWKENYNIGVDVIDKEHKRLFRIINKLYAFREEDEEKKSQWACQEGIKYFKEHAVKHFADEEQYMSSIGYNGLETHRLIHKGFREKTLPALEEELEKMEYSTDSIDHFLGVCAGWLIGHTMTEDMAITGKDERKWENLLPQEEIAANKKVIIQLLYDMFHLESKVISEFYKGERFGNGVYYRLVYGTKNDDKRWEIFMVFEENLLVNTVGKIMGIKTNKLDNMLINAARYTAQQFTARVLKHFPDMGVCELKEENLLNYEQFQQVFEMETPQISLLFNTGEGYFTYSVIAPHLLKDGIGRSIEADNALTEIERYLMEREEEQKKEPKKKILVVDDSATIQQGMKSLLGEEYEVSIANSGVAAIRAITLNKPDLVLLDYEMPVCDGKQALQMIRSEEEFKTLPVIFLTSRTDPESLKGVMSLKPSGYLSKYLKQADIKKRVDNFFKKEEKK